MDIFFILECVASILGVIYVLLLINENIWCWFFGILSSSCFIYLMYSERLYSESILYAFYVGVGFYGWYKWSKKNKGEIVIKRASNLVLFAILLVGVAGSYIVGYFFDKYTDAARPFADATTSVFSVLATFMEVYKWLSTWVFWIAINFFTIWLYFDRELKVTSMLMVLYFLLSIFGFMQWHKTLAVQKIKVH